MHLSRKLKNNDTAVFAVVLAGIVLFFFAFDTAVPGLTFGQDIDDSPFSAAVFGSALGLFIGQINLVAIWAAISPGPVICRLPWAYFLMVMMWAAVAIGNYFSDGPLAPDEAIFLGAILLVSCTIAQIPLWIASRYFRWRLLPPSSAEEDDHRFNLKHLFLGTVILSASLGLARVVLHGAKPSDFIPSNVDKEMFVLLGAMIVCNLLVVIPAIWAAFQIRNPIKVLAGVWTGFALIVSIIEVAFLCAVLGAPGNEAEIVIVAFGINWFQTACVFLTLSILKLCGFQLIRLSANRSS